nr:ABC transporter ATP-binding protein [Candidatus Njordarchaeota archaeon]
MKLVTIPRTSGDSDTDDCDAATTAPIRTLNLTKVFKRILPVGGKSGTVVAVNDLNLTVPQRSIYGFLGPNGAGKTTTIRMLVGLLLPTSGTASVCGHSIREDVRGAQKHIGYVPDSTKFPSMRAREFLTFFGEVAGITRSTAISRSKELLTWAGLDDKTTLETKVPRWSAGMQRKLLVAQAMIHQPDVLVLDEPTANLDPVARRSLINLLKRVAAGGRIVLLSSHDLPEVQEVCTHMGFIRHGDLVAEGSKSELFKSIGRLATDRTATFIVSGRGMKDIAKWVEKKLGAKITELQDDRMEVSTKSGERLFKVLADAVENIGGSAVTDMTEKEDTLEDVFLRLSKTTREDKEESA